MSAVNGPLGRTSAPELDLPGGSPPIGTRRPPVATNDLVRGEQYGPRGQAPIPIGPPVARIRPRTNERPDRIAPHPATGYPVRPPVPAIPGTTAHEPPSHEPLSTSEGGTTVPIPNVEVTNPPAVDLGLVIDQLVAVLAPSGAPFYWWPVEHRRHAIAGRRPAAPSGTTGQSLCGKEITLPEDDRYTWLWPSCAECWDAAKALRR